MTKPNSVVIIGGGHNGLICGTYLAKAGYKVQVLEARDNVGGGASTASFADGYRTSGLAHVLYGLNAKVCKDLKLNIANLASAPPVDTISLQLDGDHVTLARDEVSANSLSSKDVQAYRAFKQEFRGYAKALQPLMMNAPPRLKDMDKKDKLTLAKLGWSLRFGLGTNSMREFLRVGGINIYDVLNEVFDSPSLKGAIAVDAVLGQHMGPRTPNTVLTYLQRLWGETQAVQSIPVGGMGKVSEILETAAIEAGVAIRTGAKVAKILVENGRSQGVVLQSGERIDASIVVSNTDAKTTFIDLVGASQLDAMFCHRVNSVRQNGDVAKLHFALSELPIFSGLSPSQLGQRLIIAPDMRYVEHAFNHSKYGEYSENPVVEITIPSIGDSSLTPAGHHVMSVSATFAPYQLKEGWQTQSRDAFVQRVIQTIEHYAPGFSATLVATELLTPVDIEDQYNTAGGHWHHGELSIDQSFMMRPVHGSAQYLTPIDGLYLCGAAAHPGGGITGVPGHNAAQRILAMGGT
ncbi:MAG TPA: NAD(P)/FAD-dependent oxidoreductase [Porticoccaceae bacterium]|nr:NAD(P)/FAD-dependent oxidoreductase [Porticoccaceae bacterium]HIG66430.1 NAD(P)/FAD-dependent oxidoreductase [Porticoccaceae bacterium]HIK80042.1 NAD(P)/FAD-dependent oxidoreductase [Porticoccaceae bacterium]